MESIFPIFLRKIKEIIQSKMFLSGNLEGQRLYITPQHRILLIALKVLLGKILNNDLLSMNNSLKVKLYDYYKSVSTFLRRK